LFGSTKFPLGDDSSLPSTDAPSLALLAVPSDAQEVVQRLQSEVRVRSHKSLQECLNELMGRGTYRIEREQPKLVGQMPSVVEGGVGRREMMWEGGDRKQQLQQQEEVDVDKRMLLT
jgi:hypothetical protein